MKWLDIQVEGDLPGVRPRWVDVAKEITAAGISPGGKRAVFAARGDIFTVPAEKGDIRNLTALLVGGRPRSVLVARRQDPRLAVGWVADASGEYALHLAPQDGTGDARRIALGSPPSFFYEPLWSPDGKKIALYDKRLTLWIVDVASGALTKVESDLYETPYRTLEPAWSPDSRYLAYTRAAPVPPARDLRLRARLRASRPQVTDGLSDARFPAFDRGGKYLYFTASTDWGPTATWLDMSSVDHPVSRAVYVAVLDRKEPSPLAPESDEEGTAEEEERRTPTEGRRTRRRRRRGGRQGQAPRARRGGAEDPGGDTIDFDRLEPAHVAAAGAGAKTTAVFAAGKAGEIFLLEATGAARRDSEESGAAHRRSSTSRSARSRSWRTRISELRVSADGEKMLLRERRRLVDRRRGRADREGGKETKALDLDRMRGPRRSARRVAPDVPRDLADPARLPLRPAAPRPRPRGGRGEVRALPRGPRPPLRPQLPASTRCWASSASATSTSAAATLPKAPKVKGGLLGADYEIAERPLPLRPRLRRRELESRAPGAAHPARRRRRGGRVPDRGRWPRRPAAGLRLRLLREHRAGKSVRLRVASGPGGAGRARRHRGADRRRGGCCAIAHWVEDNRRTVDRLCGGRLGYVHLPDTARGGFAQLQPLLLRADRQARDGARRALQRRRACRRLHRRLPPAAAQPGAWPRATASTSVSPGGAIHGPKVMLINETSGSGGDALPWIFRELDLGPLVGTRTWGGLVGIYDYPELLDGGARHRAARRPLRPRTASGKSRTSRRRSRRRGRAAAERLRRTATIRSSTRASRSCSKSSPRGSRRSRSAPPSRTTRSPPGARRRDPDEGRVRP